MDSDVRSPICSIPAPSLAAIQKGTMAYTWRGVACNKDPFDFALYPLLLWRERPATIIEIGSKEGGSALWLAETCSMFGIATKLISIDVNQRAKIEHPKISFLRGNGRQLENTLTEDFLTGLPRPWLVIDDADHHYETTLAILRFFHRHLQVGEYILVEDGIVDSFEDAHRYAHFDGGPNRALSEFMAAHPYEYRLDTNYCDFFGYNVTWNTNGYLKRIA